MTRSPDQTPPAGAEREKVKQEMDTVRELATKALQAANQLTDTRVMVEHYERELDNLLTKIEDNAGLMLFQRSHRDSTPYFWQNTKRNNSIEYKTIGAALAALMEDRIVWVNSPHI